MKNSEVLFDPSLETLLARCSDPVFVEARFRSFSQARIRHLLIFHNGPKDTPSMVKTLHTLIKVCKRYKLKIEFVSPEKFKDNDQRYIHSTCSKLAKIMRKNKHIVIAYLPKDDSLVQQFGCIAAYLSRRKSKRKGSADALLSFAANYLRRPIENKTDPILFGYRDYYNNTVAKVKAKKPKKFSRGDTNDNEFDLSRFTIRFKLISIISAIIFVSLGTMTYFTSLFFNQNAETTIQENNLKLAEVIGSQIQSELENIRYSTKLTVRFLASENANSFFVDNPSFFYVGIGEIKRGFFQEKEGIYNVNYLAENKMNKSSIHSASARASKYISRATNRGSYITFNASLADVPVMGLAYGLSGYTVVIYLQPNKLLKVLQKSGAVVVFVVNRDGDVIAHQDSNSLINHANYLDVPIVQTMLQSKVKTGQNRYHYEGSEYMGSYHLLDVGRLGVIAQIDTNIVFAPVRQIQFNNILIVVIVLCIAVFIVFYFSKTITMPITNLVYGAQEIEKGNYDIKIIPEFRDEVGRLTYTFRRMAVGLGEREKMKDAFIKFVNKEVAERVLKGEVKLGGEQKEAAIFFSDLRGFTAMSENMTPEEVVTFLNAYFTEMVRCVNQTHGIVDKYIGDAIMAHWGAIGGQGDSTEGAINASLMMRKVMITFNAQNQGKFPIAKTGIGINTGPVISGQIGSEDRLEYTVIGDAVNLASRIESLNKPFGTDLLISSDAYEKVKSLYNVEAMPAIKVKGKSEPQVIYTVLGRKDDPNCPKSLSQLRGMLGIVDKKIAVDYDKSEEKFEVINKK